jgi:hypothetical protein
MTHTFAHDTYSQLYTDAATWKDRCLQAERYAKSYQLQLLEYQAKVKPVLKEVCVCAFVCMLERVCYVGVCVFVCMPERVCFVGVCV